MQELKTAISWPLHIATKSSHSIPHSMLDIEETSDAAIANTVTLNKTPTGWVDVDVAHSLAGGFTICGRGYRADGKDCIAVELQPPDHWPGLCGVLLFGLSEHDRRHSTLAQRSRSRYCSTCPEHASPQHTHSQAD
eukprot:6026884-Pyramimonas_sp.AAC.2